MRCPGCGQPSWLAYDKELSKKWEAPLPKRCHPCTEKSARMAKYQGDDVRQPEALHFRVHLKD